MLLQFSFENFRSFRGKTTLSMLATTQRTLNDVLIRKGKRRILPSAVLYGANASGKSNVILAMMALRAIVENGSISRADNTVMSNLELFPFIHDGNAEPISFEIDFITGRDRFAYFLSISVEPINEIGKRRILEERLELVLSKKAIVLFHRTKDDIDVGRDEGALKVLGYKDVKKLRLLVDSVVQNMDEETLFLTGGFKSAISKVTADKIINYISKRILTLMGLSERLFINNLHTVKGTITTDDNTDDNTVIFDELNNIIVQAADFGPQKIGWQAKAKDKQGVSEMVMVSMYRKSIIPSYLMESAGTIKLLNFFFLLRQFFLEGDLLMIDEMDNVIHPEIIKGVIALFGNPEANKNGAQLIFTTHNPIYMDHDLLRRDQILFTEKDQDSYESRLYSLGDFGSVDVRNDQSFMRNYFKGRYGRLPYIDLETILVRGMEV